MSETGWLKGAFTKIHTEGKVNLASFLKDKVSDDPVEGILKDFRDMRNAISHAKDQNNPLPHSLEKRKELIDTQARLVRLYLSLAREYNGIVREVGDIDEQTFKNKVAKLENTFQIYVCSQETEIVRKAVGIDECGDYIEGDPVFKSGPIVPLTAKRMPALDSDNTAYFLATAPGSEMDQVKGKVQIWTYREGSPPKDTLIEGNLTFDGIEEFQVLLGVRLRNIREPKRYYGT